MFVFEEEFDIVECGCEAALGGSFALPAVVCCIRFKSRVGIFDSLLLSMRVGDDVFGSVLILIFSLASLF